MIPGSSRSAAAAAFVLTSLAITAPLSSAVELPLKRVVAFNSGVAYFEYAGQVSGDQTMELSFDTDDVNDVLKSLLLLDQDGGHASAVTYDNREPVLPSLEALSVDLRENTGLASLLRQLRGHEIELGGAKNTRGRVVSVETRSVARDQTMVERDFLLLSVEGGLSSLPVDELDEIRLVDEKLNGDFQRALELLAMRSGSDTKRVKIDFRGEGDRRVRVGLIQEFPVWKTSYRLVLTDDDKPLLQGWAMVENTSNTKWDGVDVALVSGRPISFKMDLYEPLYVRRPTVVAEQFAGLTPRVYHGDDPFGDFDDSNSDGAMEGAGGLGGGGFGGGGGAFGGAFGGAVTNERRAAQRRQELAEATVASVRAQQTVASGEEVGELFRYQIDAPVTLEAEHSTMLPIVNAVAAGERLSIYNASVHAEHPLLGLRLTNTTELHLAAGPITVFDGGEYAGDARLGDVPAGDQRLLSYAVDQQTSVATEPIDVEEQLVSARIDGQTLMLKRRMTRGQVYRAHNASDKERRLLIEHPVASGWKLTSPEKAEETTTEWRRFELAVEAGKTKELRVQEQSTSEYGVALVNLSDAQRASLLAERGVPEEVRQTLQRFADWRRSIEEAETAAAETLKRLTAFAAEHERIRKNMQTLDTTSQLYQRYEEKLGEQESEIERLQAELPRHRAKIEELRKRSDWSE
ncbi:hypothetical protein Pla123a_16790 [Posidoniimonas polymericola]|uniref:DUF4139 domain-containing protein n=1 Tax=Posidoniimonas polymericola TaxID=2528002 RepID=A0A5C5YSV5_9BACT|nr:DUF4139 domain-containing protein [Posidoniimonas polymericola]TWT77881.1 hypothetical protein Pla123a_16790 [Posidoniimonas polymericola]